MTRLLTILALVLSLGGGAQPASAGGGKVARPAKVQRAQKAKRVVAKSVRPSASKATARSRAKANPFQRKGPVIIDIGGEGRVRNAINLNPGHVTSTTGAPGRPIPNRIGGVGERMPFRSKSADVLRVESAPLRPGAASELARVIRPGGRIVLRHPEGYAKQHHSQVARTVGGTFQQRTVGDMTITIIRAP